MQKIENPKQHQIVSCRMDKDSWFDLKLIALSAGISMGDIIRGCLDKYIKANKGKVRISNE